MANIIEPTKQSSATNITDSLKGLYVAFGGNADDVATLANITDVSNAIAVLLGGEGNATSISQAIQNIIPVVPTGSGTAVNELIDRSVTEISNDTVTTVGNGAFMSCTALTSIDFPNATKIGTSAFQGCSLLTTCDFPNMTNIGQNSFKACVALTDVSLPKVTTVGDSAFSFCSSLTTIELPAVTSIGNSAFSSCAILESVILPNNQVASGGFDMFNGTPIAGNVSTGVVGYIYVPDDLVNSYKAQSRWNTYAAQIKPISEYPNN